MKYLITCIPEITEVAAAEAEELLKIKATILEQGIIELETKKINEYIYHAQAIQHCGEKVEKITISKDKTFAIRCLFINTEKEEGCIEEHAKTIKAKVDLKNPDFLFTFIHTQKKVYIMNDLTQFPLDKRSYRIRPHKETVNATLAYATIYYSGYKNNRIIDPFCKDGTIAIEAAIKTSHTSLIQLTTKRPKVEEPKEQKIKEPKEIIAASSEQPETYNTDTHAKLAKVHKYITIKRYDIEWLDTKVEEKTIEKIITNLPRLSTKKLQELFYQAEYMLKKEGAITMITTLNPEEIKKAANEYEYATIIHNKIKRGETQLTILTCKKGKILKETVTS